MAVSKKSVAPRILVPKTVSFSLDSRKGYQPWGTKAFVERGTRLPRGLTGAAKRSALNKMAHESSHFIKTYSPRARRIAEILEQNGINVEKEIQDLKNGKSLFERKGFSFDSKLGQDIFLKKPFTYLEKLEDIVAKMHSLGITHNHLHMGNFAITPNGEIILLDLGRATSFKVPEKIPEGWLLKKFEGELGEFAKGLANLYGEAQHKVRKVIVPLDVLRDLKSNIQSAVVAKYSEYFQQVPYNDAMKLMGW